MDDKDGSIIRVLGRRAGLSTRALAKMVNIHRSTVYRRVKKLEEKGIIVGYKAVINFEKTTWPIGALLLIDLSKAIPGKGPIPKKDVLRSLRNFDEIEEIIEVQAADFNLVVRARFRTFKKLSEFIEELTYIEGIGETFSAIITEETILPPPM